MILPYWFISTLTALPAFLWVYVLLGVPVALLLLPRTDWADRPLVVMTGFALGPGLLTAWMFALGSAPAPLLTHTNVLAGLAALTLAAWALLVLKWRRSPAPHPPEYTALTPGERLLVGLLVVAVAVRAVVTAFWAFTAYDALWVYGYQGRLYTLINTIPAHIDYYPPFISLQYAFGQLVVGGIDDSAARAVLPLLHMGSILAAYTLGQRAANRRTGIFLAGLWALYPAVGAWSRMGDLEIPLAFLVAGSAAYFFMAWKQPHAPYARRYALLAGLIYGVALWTKPTAGGFALGVVFINLLELSRHRFGWAAYRPRFVISAITGAACVPLGGVWYLRNLALGHNAVDFPPNYWYTLAERGGGQLLWYAAAITALCVLLAVQRRLSRPMLAGAGLVLMGITPSAIARFLNVGPNAPVLWLLPSLNGLPRMGLFEWGVVAVGLALLARALWPLRHQLDGHAALAGWVVAATLPYFALYFWRYSYHYRLSFAIVPMLALPTALILARLAPNADVRGWTPARRYVLAGLLFCVSLPGLLIPLYDPFLGWGYLWDGTLPTDRAKRESGNAALMWMVNGFEIYEAENGVPPIVVAPGVQRLPFFFPTADIRNEIAPTDLNALTDVVYFVDSHPDGTGAYEGVPLAENQVLAALGRQDISRWAWGMDDGIFRYDIYEMQVDARFTEPTPIAPADGEVIFGGFARLIGHDLGLDVFEIGQRRVMKLFWEVLEKPQQDYMTYIHLRTADGKVIQAWDGPVGLMGDGRYYTTLVWEPGEYITDERGFRLTNADAPPGDGYQLVVGLYDLTTNTRVPITQNGEPIGDGYNLGEDITITPPQGE